MCNTLLRSSDVKRITLLNSSRFTIGKNKNKLINEKSANKIIDLLDLIETKRMICSNTILITE